MRRSTFLDCLDRDQLALYWLLFAVLSLFLSGALAFFTAMARMPGVAQFFTDISFFRRMLVTHVDLGVAVWFTSMPVSLFHILNRGLPVQSVCKWSFSVALAGVLLMVVTGFFGGGEPLLSNYVPVISHPLFMLGLALYFSGTAMNYLNPQLWRPSSPRATASPQEAALFAVQMGVRLGALYFLASLLSILAAGLLLPSGYGGAVRYEIMMWGGGHVLQFANISFMLVCWTMLLAAWTGRVLIRRWEACLLFSWLGLPLLLVPWLASQSLTGPVYREGFTLLMRWGLFPPSVVYLGLTLHRLRALRARPGCASSVAFLGAAALLLTGFLLGALVRGPDLRLPGHYHASIGAVTLSFMAAAYLLLKELGLPAVAKPRLACAQLMLYATGQLTFSLGMFVAGAYGMTRKVYGAEQHIRNLGQTIGLGVMGAGGAIALASGFLFMYLIAEGFRQGRGVFRPGRTFARSTSVV